MVILGAAVIVLAICQVWLRLQVTSMGYELSAGRGLQAKLENHRAELEIELETLTRPERLAKEAKLRLGLVAPKRGQVVDLR